MRVKYKVTSCFGDKNLGEIIDAILLSKDDDSGVALLYHPATNKYECGSFEFCKEKRGIYVNAFGEDVYINLGSWSNTNTKFRKFLKNIELEH